MGAVVAFRHSGSDQSGTVTSVVDGKAYVDQINRDGSTTKQILDPSDIRVVASKATLPPDGSKIFDPDNNLYKVMNSPEYKQAMDKFGESLIEREDGYSLSSKILEDSVAPVAGETEDLLEDTDKNKSKGNPILYQLFAPTGRSLGTYSRGAEKSFDSMVSQHKGGGEAVTASAEEVSPVDEAKPFRVPAKVKEDISASLAELASVLPAEDLEIAQRLANDATVSFSDVVWVHGYFSETDPMERVHGGYKGRQWANKIVENGEDTTPEITGHPKYTFDDDIFAYFAVGDTPGSTFVNRLLAVEAETGDVFSWTPEGFVLVPEIGMEDVDEPQIIPIDEMTADTFAHWLDENPKGEFDIVDSDPLERNLFTLADPEMDYDELDRGFGIIASANQYTPQERSQNAKRQRRASGGRFGEAPDEPEDVPQEREAPRPVKATLPMELPLVENPAARIAEWLSTAAEAPIVAAGEEYTEEDQAIEDNASGPSDEALYFAIVDEVSKTSVIDLVAIVKHNNEPIVYRRSSASWEIDNEAKTILQGNTPPPVVEVSDAETVKTVIQQIDAHDAENPPEDAVTASGGSVEELENRIAQFSGTEDIFVKADIRRRARALNRMDLVPKEWREFTLAEIGELTASETLYGEYGEIIVAAGVPGIADTPSDWKNVMKLQNYWTRGKGALKIRWGTPGDLTRAHRHLSKYVGPQRAWGLAQKYHKSLFGVYNHTHDVATGQYRPRKRRK